MSDAESNSNFLHLIDFLSEAFSAPLVNFYYKKPQVNSQNPILKSELLQL